MYCDSHGSTRFPDNSKNAKRYGGEQNREQWYIHNEATGMEYELWESDGGLILGAHHEDVGLVIYYGIDREYWDHLEAQASEATNQN